VLNLTAVDWLIMLLYFVFVLGIGFALKRYMKTSKDFFPGWARTCPPGSAGWPSSAPTSARRK
jgi:Na+/proline symporter